MASTSATTLSACSWLRTPAATRRAGGRHHPAPLGLRGGLLRGLLRGRKLSGDGLHLGVERGVAGSHLGGAVGQPLCVGGQGRRLVLELGEAAAELAGPGAERSGAVPELDLAVVELGGAGFELAGALVQGHGAVVEPGDAVGELACAVGGLEHLRVDGAESGEELVGGLLAHLLGDRRVHGGGQLVHDGAQEIVVGIVGGDIEHGLVGGVEAAGGDQVRGKVLRDFQGERVGAVADALVRFLGAGDRLPVEDVAVHQALGHLPAGLQPRAVGGRGTGVLDHQGRIDLVQLAVRIPVGVEVHGAVEQRDEGQGQDGQLGQQPAGHAFELGAGQPQHSHFASSVSGRRDSGKAGVSASRWAASLGVGAVRWGRHCRSRRRARSSRPECG